MLLKKIENFLFKTPCEVIGFISAIIIFWSLVIATIYPSYKTFFLYKELYRSDISYYVLEASKSLANNSETAYESNHTYVSDIGLIPVEDFLIKTEHMESNSNSNDFSVINDVYIYDKDNKINNEYKAYKQISNNSAIEVTIDSTMYNEKRNSITTYISISILICSVISLIIGKIIFTICKRLRRARINSYEDATRDELTGVFNRRYLEDIFDRESKSSIRHNYSLSIIMFDMDDIMLLSNAYNDNFSNCILKQVAQYSNELVRSRDIFCRIGGDQFIILSPYTDITDAKKLAERIRAGIEEKTFCSIYKNEKVKIKQTCSFGITKYNPTKDENLYDVLKRADNALSKSKNTGKNKIKKSL